MINIWLAAPDLSPPSTALSPRHVPFNAIALLDRQALQAGCPLWVGGVGVCLHESLFSIILGTGGRNFCGDVVGHVGVRRDIHRIRVHRGS
jgi:hypothetical protein